MKNSGTFMKGIKPRKVPCRIQGCTNHWIWSPEEQMMALSEGNAEVPLRMCDECYRIFETLEVQEIPCSRPGCSGKWQYGRLAQMQDRKRGRTQPPARLCPECEGQAAQLEEREMPCKVPGCSGTWKWTGRSQIAASAPPEKMCDSCYRIWQGLSDVQVPCQARGCERTWTWTRMAQLEARVAGKTEPPRRFCNECYERFRTLEDRQVPCRIEECERMWTWTRMAQLEAWLREGDGAQPPLRMCADCASSLAQAQDETHPCRIPGCAGTWTEKASAVFARSRSGSPHPSRMCDACVSRMEALEDQTIPCRYQRYGCTGTFVWKKESQLRAEKSGHAAAPRKACPSCEAALARGKKSAQIHCRVCGRFIMQLSDDDIIQIHLGRRVRPSDVCPDCSRKETAPA